VGDDIVERLEWHGTCVRNAEGLCLLQQSLYEIKRLRAALRLAAVEVFGHCDPTTTSPDQLVQHFIEESAVAEVITDGFGSEWEKCLRRDCDLQVVRPGKVQCNGDHDEIGCPQSWGGLVDGLCAELEVLAAALSLAVGELSTHGNHRHETPDMLRDQFIEEARRG
jgi:hypothetical protein